MKKSILWKLLRKHVSVAQMAGFAVANMVGLTIVLLGLQFYSDVKPVFDDDDGFLRKDYLVVTKRVSGISSLKSMLGGNTANAFSDDELQRLRSQEWVRNIGEFMTSNYEIYGSVSLPGKEVSLRTSFFFEAVPDEFIDVKSDEWKFDPSHPVVPIIMSKDYLSLYNFGFAASQGMPQVSEGMMGAVPIMLRLTGRNGKSEYVQGKVVGFSNRLNTIVVPYEFMRWSNERYAPGVSSRPSRLIVEVSKPGDIAIEKYMKANGYEIAGDKLHSNKAGYMLNIVMSIVIGIGLIISLLSFFILILSIYLLLQKNTRKLQDLLLLGYSPAEVSGLYVRMVVYVNAAVYVLSVGVMLALRSLYLPYLAALGISGSSLLLSAGFGLLIIGLISAGNVVAIRRKVKALWLVEK